LCLHSITGWSSQQKVNLAEAGIEAGADDDLTYDLDHFLPMSSDDESSNDSEDSKNVGVEVSRDGEVADGVQRETFKSYVITTFGLYHILTSILDIIMVSSLLTNGTTRAV
jgi:hypothetical protein